MLEWLGGKKYKYPNTRQYLRLPASWPVKWEPTQHAGAPGVAATKDVSAGGIALVVREMIPAGSRIQIEIHVPALNRSIPAQGQVVRCLLAKGGGFELGIRFAQISAEDQKALREAIDKFASPRDRSSLQRSWWRKIT